MPATRAVTADYLVGADGAHSRVRSELGLDFQGHPYLEGWLLADGRLDWDRRDDERHAFFRRDGRPLICMPMRDNRWRVILPYAGDRHRQAPALGELQRLVAERAPEPVPVSDPSWLATFRCQRRSTHVYRRGRVMLAGDAVHIHSPADGQGMNTGIMDARNLAWKLALVACGRAPGPRPASTSPPSSSDPARSGYRRRTGCCHRSMARGPCRQLRTSMLASRSSPGSGEAPRRKAKPSMTGDRNTSWRSPLARTTAACHTSRRAHRSRNGGRPRPGASCPIHMLMT